MNTNTTKNPPYLIAYYIVLVVLGIFVAIIIGKLMFWPPCTPTGPKDTACIVDGWSVAGLAATVLGVGAAILTLLGAFAVAAWWTGLDRRIRKQVTELYQKQQEQISAQVEKAINEQKVKMDTQLAKFQSEFQKLDEQFLNINAQVQKTLDEQKMLDTRITSYRSEFQKLDGRLLDISARILREDQQILMMNDHILIALQMSTPEWQARQVLGIQNNTQNVAFAVEQADNFLRHIDACLDIVNSSPDEAMKKALSSDDFNPAINFKRAEEALALVLSELSKSNNEIPDLVSHAQETMEEYRPRIEQWKQKFEEWKKHQSGS